VGAPPEDPDFGAGALTLGEVCWTGAAGAGAEGTAGAGAETGAGEAGDVGATVTRRWASVVRALAPAPWAPAPVPRARVGGAGTSIGGALARRAGIALPAATTGAAH
jgi:hypothetical protein